MIAKICSCDLGCLIVRDEDFSEYIATYSLAVIGWMNYIGF